MRGEINVALKLTVNVCTSSCTCRGAQSREYFSTFLAGMQILGKTIRSAKRSCVCCETKMICGYSHRTVSFNVIFIAIGYSV